MSVPIPPAIRRFILTSIASVPHLEALLLLRASAPEAWAAGRVAERLYVAETATLKLLDDLCRGHMVAREDEHYAYRPHSEHLRATIDELAEVYARNLVDVTHLIHSRVDRQAQHFADAFRLRKDS